MKLVREKEAKDQNSLKFTFDLNEKISVCCCRGSIHISDLLGLF